MCGLMSLSRILTRIKSQGQKTCDAEQEGSVATMTDLLVLALCVLPVSAGVQRVAEERLAGAATLLPGPRPDRHGHESGRHRRLRQIWYPNYTSSNVPIKNSCFILS